MNVPTRNTNKKRAYSAMVAKIFYFIALAFVVSGSWIFCEGMNPLLQSTFMASSLLMAFIFFVWGRYLFREDTPMQSPHDSSN